MEPCFTALGAQVRLTQHGHTIGRQRQLLARRGMVFQKITHRSQQIQAVRLFTVIGHDPHLTPLPQAQGRLDPTRQVEPITERQVWELCSAFGRAIASQ